MSKPWERYQAPAEDGPWAKYAAPEAEPAMPTRSDLMKRELLAPVRAVRDVAAGAVRGAGSIGATLFSPFDAAEDALQRLITGRPTGTSRNTQRREAMTGALSSMGADTESTEFGAGKLGGEIAGTLGVGPALAGAAPAAVAARAPALVDAVRTAGMSAAGRTGAAGLAARTVGGGVAGGAAAGLVNPADADAGAAIGAAAPGVLQVAGRLGTAAGNVMRSPAQSPEVAAAVQSARGAGYVIPPTQARPTLGNRVLEGLAGKITTAQNASARNQGVTNRLAAEALGLPPDTAITPQVLKTLRDDAGKAYQSLKTLGDMTGDAQFNRQLAGLKGAFEGAAKDFPGLAKPELSAMLDSLKQPRFKASSAIDAVRILRDEADAAFVKGDKGTAKALRSASRAMEDLIERNLLRMNAERSLTGIMRNGGGVDDIVGAGVNNPATQMLQQFREARRLIAKTYTVEKALNPASGSVDARKLAAELKKGKPLSGELKTAAEFGLQFPKAAQAVEGMGSLPQTSPLDWIPAGAMSAGFGNPLLMLGVGARPAARSAALSGPVQNRLLQPAPGPTMNALQNPQLQQLLLRGAPVALSPSSGAR